MKFNIDNQILRQFPNLKIGIFVLKNLDNSKKIDISQSKIDLGEQKPSDLPEIKKMERSIFVDGCKTKEIQM